MNFFSGIQECKVYIDTSVISSNWKWPIMVIKKLEIKKNDIYNSLKKFQILE
jgi:hypothetical protein